MTTRCLSQFTHVYSIKEIHHIDDDGIGGVYSKVGFISVFICKCKCCAYDWLEGAKKTPKNVPNLRFSHCVFQENISKAPCVQRYDYSTGSHGCSMVRFYEKKKYYPSFVLNTFANPFLLMPIYYLYKNSLYRICMHMWPPIYSLCQKSLS